MSATSPTVEFGPAERPDREAGRGAGSRRAYRRAVRGFRSRRTLAATLVSAVLTVAAVLAAIQVVSQLVGRTAGVVPTADLAGYARDTSFDDPAILIGAGVAVLLGLWLLALAVLPGRARVVPLSTDREDVVLVVRPGVVERQAARAAESAPGVTRARASLRRGRLRVRADSGLREPGSLAEQVRTAVAGRVGQLAPIRPPQIGVQLRSREE